MEKQMKLTVKSTDGLLSRIAMITERRSCKVTEYKVVEAALYKEVNITIKDPTERSTEVHNQLMKLVDVVEVQVSETLLI